MGHEGPYSLNSLESRKSSPDTKVWAEGLNGPVPLKLAIEKATIIKVVKVTEEVPVLPPLPIEEDIPPLPVLDSAEQLDSLNPHQNNLKKSFGLFIGALLVFSLGLKEWVSTQEQFSFQRAKGMNPELFQKISSEFKFEGWDKKIFFKEYVASDMSHVWLVTSGFQNCQVHASFTSLKDKLIATDDVKISFKSSTTLEGHVAEFSQFEFVSGSKIIPGMYEMDLEASQCSWDGLAARLGNFFRSPDAKYVTRMKVVLFHQGSAEFNSLLAKLIQKKMEMELRNQNQEELFWQDLQQKFQTLLAITLQIEQLLLDFSETSVSDFSKNLKIMVDKYTKNYGRFLTDFVVANEKYFLDLEKSELLNMSIKRPYEGVVKLTSKEIGLESMKIIEELQNTKKPSREFLQNIAIKAKKRFEIIKNGVNKKILQISEDRTN
jgi:hypothetical protein